MKNLSLLSLTLLLTLFILPLNAQPQFGLKAGLNIANIVGDVEKLELHVDLDSKTGFTGGIFFMYQFSDLFAIQPEVYYTMKGATADIMGVVDVTLTFDYIEVPVLLKLIIPVEGSNIRPSIFAGPSVGFNSTAKFKVEADGESEEEDIEDVKSTEFGLVFGGGVGIMIGKNELGFDIRYILGLSTLDDTPAPDNIDITSTVISFNIYFGFSLL